MELNIYTVYDRIDGAANQLWLCRSDGRMVHDFVSQIDSRNRDLKAKGFPPINLEDFEIRRVGVFEDTTCVIDPSYPPEVIPFNSSSQD